MYAYMSFIDISMDMSMDTSMDIYMDMSMDTSMDISMAYPNYQMVRDQHRYKGGDPQ